MKVCRMVYQYKKFSEIIANINIHNLLKHKLSRKSKELEYFAEEKHSLIEKLENLTFENSEYKKSIDYLNEEIEHFKSEEYHMEVALPYTLEVAKKQGRINELENHLNNLL